MPSGLVGLPPEYGPPPYRMRMELPPGQVTVKEAQISPAELPEATGV